MARSCTGRTRPAKAGASVFRGVEGFGAPSLIHALRRLSLSEDLPVAIVIVDTEERVRAFLPKLDELVTEGLVILEDCMWLFRDTDHLNAVVLDKLCDEDF